MDWYNIFPVDWFTREVTSSKFVVGLSNLVPWQSLPPNFRAVPPPNLGLAIVAVINLGLASIPNIVRTPCILSLVGDTNAAYRG